MKIIQVLPAFGLAGAEIMAETLIYELKKNNIEPVVVSLYNFNSSITDRITSQNIKIYYLDKKVGFDFSVITKLRKIVKAEKPDAIHTHLYVLPYVYLSTLGLPIKIVHTIHNIADKEVSAKQQILHKYLFPKKRVIPVAISPLVKETVINRYGRKLKNIPMVYNGIDMTKYFPKKDYSLHNEGTIVHIGRFNAQKNHSMLIMAFKMVTEHYPNAKLLLVGDGELKQTVMNLVEDYHMNKNIIFMGLRDDISDILFNSDIFVLPSNYEGMPMTIIEAMSTGLPIIATRVGGIPDMISDKSGILIDNDYKELASKIILLLSDERLREKIGYIAEEESKNFSSYAMAKKYISLYGDKKEFDLK